MRETLKRRARRRVALAILGAIGPVPFLLMAAFVALMAAMGGGGGAASPAPAAAAALGSAPPPVPGGLAWPLRAPISQAFGCTGVGLEPPRGSCAHFHTGIDIAASMGTPVRAACPGSVALAVDSSYGFGIHVVIACSDPAVSTLYGHLQSRLVATGDSVTQGQVIGYEGSTGNSSGPHLHFEVDTAGGPVDPMGYLAP